MIKIIQPLVSEFLPFAKKRMGFKKPPKIFLKSDNQNAKDPLGKTAYYDPENRSVTLYITDRHPKDIMRSLSHELVHHTQNCNGEFDKVHSVGDGYAQNDEHLREMEREAYEMGNLCFRDWEDGIKNTTYYESLNKGAQINMSTKDWKNKELTQLLSEAWGFKFNSLQEFEEFDGPGEVQEEASEVEGEVQEEAAEPEAEVQEEGEEIEELAQAKATGDRRKPHKRTAVPEKDEEELEERRGRGRDREGMAPDERRRPMAMEEVVDDADGEEVVEESDEDIQEEAIKSKTTISEAKIREILKKAIKLAKARKTTKE
tara:strand:- start:14646 stop:15593 length:948 start_codon:yes stop_codon:yes gene_type:complete